MGEKSLTVQFYMFFFKSHIFIGFYTLHITIWYMCSNEMILREENTVVLHEVRPHKGVRHSPVGFRDYLSIQNSNYKK